MYILWLRCNEKLDHRISFKFTQTADLFIHTPGGAAERYLNSCYVHTADPVYIQSKVESEDNSGF